LPSTHLSEDEEKAYNHIWERKETKGMDQRFLGATSRETQGIFIGTSRCSPSNHTIQIKEWGNPKHLSGTAAAKAQHCDRRHVFNQQPT
jgi:hypothetical protein